MTKWLSLALLGAITATCRARPEDAGRWMMHCHILEHAEAGMMTTLAVTAADAPPS